jgi:hypothetical protein
MRQPTSSQGGPAGITVVAAPAAKVLKLDGTSPEPVAFAVTDPASWAEHRPILGVSACRQFPVPAQCGPQFAAPVYR